MSMADGRQTLPRSRTFGGAASSAGSQLGWIVSRESLLRLTLSGLLAVALWLYVTSKQDPNLAIDYPQPLAISTASVPSGLTITNTLGDVRLSYRLNNPNVQVTPSNFHVFIDLAGYKPGVYRAPVTVVADPGITVVSVSPSRASVVLDALQEKHVIVRPHILIKPPFGYFAQPIRIYPNTVTLSGPRQLISQITQASVDLSLSGQTSNLYGSYPLLLEDSQGLGVSATSRVVVEPQQVQVTVPIKAAASSKSLPILVSLRGQPQSGWGVVGVNIDPSVLIAKGSPRQLRSLTTISTRPVWLSNKKANFTARVGIRLPKGVTSDTGRVTVSTKVQPVAASTTIEIGVTPQHVGAGLIARTHPGYVLVTVVGPSTGLSTVARQIQVTLDLTGLAVGAYTATPRVTVPRGFRLGTVYPNAVSVQLLVQ